MKRNADSNSGLSHKGIESEQVMMAETTKRQRIKEHEHLHIPCKNFFQRVLDLFDKNVDKLRLYQQIMLEIKHTKFDIQTVVLKMYDLFHGHDDMIESFNLLLFHRTDIRFQDSMDFVNKVQTGFRDCEHDDDDDDDDVDDDESENHCKQEYRDWVKSGNLWFKKVRSKLSGSDEYLDFLKCLYHYSRGGDIDTNRIQFLDLIKSQIGMHSELMLDLDQFLEYCESEKGAAKKPWGPSYTLLPPPEKRAVVSEKNPELNVLNNRYLCRANNHNFKGRVLSHCEKRKFEWEDRRHRLDMKLEEVKSVIARIQEWLVSLTLMQKKKKKKKKKGMKDFISILNIKCIERIYGREDASVILETMSYREDPTETLNLVLARMRVIQEEQSNVIQKFRRIPNLVE